MSCIMEESHVYELFSFQMTSLTNSTLNFNDKLNLIIHQILIYSTWLQTNKTVI